MYTHVGRLLYSIPWKLLACMCEVYSVVPVGTVHLHDNKQYTNRKGAKTPLKV